MNLVKLFNSKFSNSIIEVEIDNKLINYLFQHNYQHSSNPTMVPVNHYDLIMSIGLIKTKRISTNRPKFSDFAWLLDWIKSGNQFKIIKHSDSEMQKQISEELGIGVAIQLTKYFFKVHKSTISKIGIANRRTPDITCISCNNQIINIEAKGTTGAGTRRGQIKYGLTQKNNSCANIKIISATLLKEAQISNCIYQDPPIIPPDNPEYRTRLMKADHYARVFNLIGQKELSEYFYLIKKRIIYDMDFPEYSHKEELYNKLKNGYIKFRHMNNTYIGNVDIAHNSKFQFMGVDERLISIAGFLDFVDYNQEIDLFFGDNKFYVSTDGVCVGYIKNINELPTEFKEDINSRLQKGEIKHFQEYTTITDIDSMNYYALNKYFIYLFTKLGFNISKEVSDKKIRYDYVISYKRTEYFVEIKKSSSKIKLKYLQKIFYEKTKNKKLIFITNQKLVEETINYLRDKKIIIIDREVLKNILSNNKILFELL